MLFVVVTLTLGLFVELSLLVSRMLPAIRFGAMALPYHLYSVRIMLFVVVTLTMELFVVRSVLLLTMPRLVRVGAMVLPYKYSLCFSWW